MHVAHASRGRLRLRTSEHDAADPSFFSSLGQRLGDNQQVHEVRTTARTGSVLVLFGGELAPLLDWVRALGLIELEQPRPHTPMLRLQHALAESESRLSERTRGVITPGTLAFAVSALGAAFQVKQGYALPSALSLIEVALRALDHEAARERDELQKRH